MCYCRNRSCPDHQVTFRPTVLLEPQDPKSTDQGEAIPSVAEAEETRREVMGPTTSCSTCR